MLHHLLCSSLAFILLAGLVGCGGGEPSSEPAEHAEAAEPLRPLIYTERPDLSAAAAAVRERRLMRQLLDGSSSSGTWGSLEQAHEAERLALSTPDELAAATLRALVGRDESLWDHLFVAPVDYAGMVHLELDASRKFVDDIQGKSRQVWRSFEPARASESIEGGLGAVLEVEGLELGEGRTLSGSIAGEGEPVAQYWGNELELRLKGTDVIFELRIQKILRVTSPRDNPGQPVLALAAPVEMSSQLGVYLQAGLHLKPQLLQPREYPYPLAVGNFWRYRRRLAEQKEAQQNDPAAALQELERMRERLGATETILEVTSVDDYGSWRLVTLRRSYNDESFTGVNQHWVTTPRRIYRCSDVCVQHVDDLGWLLNYFSHQTPIFRFPLGLEDAWGAGGEARAERADFQVGADWHDVPTREGSYTNTVSIEGTGPLSAMDPYHRRGDQTRYFAHGRGIVRRELRQSDADGGVTVIEELVESRIMPR